MFGIPADLPGLAVKELYMDFIQEMADLLIQKGRVARLIV